MSLAGCQINPYDVNFHLQKSLEIFDKNSADKIRSRKDKGWKVPSLMPIRGKLPLTRIITLMNELQTLCLQKQILNCMIEIGNQI